MSDFRALLKKVVQLSRHLENMTKDVNFVNGQFLYTVEQADIYLAQGLNIEIMTTLEEAIKEKKKLILELQEADEGMYDWYLNEGGSKLNTIVERLEAEWLEEFVKEQEEVI